jgi:hypothetical protein
MRFLDEYGLRWVCYPDLVNWLVQFATSIEEGQFPGVDPRINELVWNIVTGLVEIDVRDRSE